jgi:citrate lyase beta subunit
MKHNQHNKTFEFQAAPKEFNKWTEKSTLQYCLGGTLYMPGTRNFVEKIIKKQMPELTSMVMCCEDAVSLEDLHKAEINVLEQLNYLNKELADNSISINDIPLIFVRVRNPEQFNSFTSRLNKEQAKLLCGFVFPKFYSSNGTKYLDRLNYLNGKFDTRLYGMPILEGREIAFKETRSSELLKLKKIINSFQDLILNIRVGGTDFSSIFGVRRGINSSIYDIHPVRDALSEILNFFSRSEDEYTISGPVWEYFLAYKNDDLQALMSRKLSKSLLTREPILNPAIDGLLREVVIDKTNGFVGKTVIHPSHLKIVNAMQAVTLEEYQDAKQILGAVGGVIKSKSSNKMNEINPHRNWAKKVIQVAAVFGVIANEDQYLHLLMDDFRS